MGRFAGGGGRQVQHVLDTASLGPIGLAHHAREATPAKSSPYHDPPGPGHHCPRRWPAIGVSDGMTITAVVVNYNTRALLRSCLESLGDWPEVVVVDNASTDGSAAMVAQDFPGVKLVRNDRNSGFGTGVNLGALHATGEALLVLNPDTWVTPGVHEILERFLESRPQAGIVGCALLDDDGRTLVSARRFYTPKALVARRLAPGSTAVREFEMLDEGDRRPRRADWVAGTGMAVRKELFSALGGFDDRFFLYFEDVDLCLRAWLAGAEVWYLPEARIYHQEQRASSRSAAALGHHLNSWTRFVTKWRGARPGFVSAPKKESGSGRGLRVVVEARALLGHLTGVGRSLESLVAHLAERDDLDLRLLVTSARRTREIHRYRYHARTFALPLPARLVDASWEKIALPPVEALTGKCDVVHGPNFVLPPSTSAARVLTVHDLGFVELPQLHSPAQRRLAELAPRAVRRADRVIAVSEFTKERLCTIFGTDPSKVDVVYHGVRRLPTDGPPLSRSFPADFVLFAGTFELRKGADILLMAYRIAREKDPGIPPLIVAGKMGLGGKQALDEAFAGGLDPGAVRLLGGVPDTLLARLYEAASVFVFPSRYEGFGMPPLEAMAHGVPTIVTAQPALLEILGDGALVVGPPPDPSRTGEIAEALANAILEVLHDRDLRRTLISRGRSRALSFSWAKAADEVARVYHAAAGDAH